MPDWLIGPCCWGWGAVPPLVGAWAAVTMSRGAAVGWADEGWPLPACAAAGAAPGGGGRRNVTSSWHRFAGAPGGGAAAAAASAGCAGWGACAEAAVEMRAVVARNAAA